MRGPAALAGAVLWLAPGAFAQEPVRDTVRVVPGPQYAAGGFHRWLFGAHYRDLWTTPIDVPVLDLEHFDGGLTPTKTGGGKQTRSLHLEGRDGGKWVFRMVAKDPAAVLSPRYRHSGVLGVVRDQISAGHPVGALMVPPLAGAAGILHATPRLAVLPDDARLGEFRGEFANQLGLLEEYPEDGSEAFGRPKKVSDTEELRERLDASPGERVDVRAFLTARLVDFVIGDWDRHEGQWRWARLAGNDGEDGVHRWTPIPRDRDQAFSRYDGVLPSLARRVMPKLVVFGDRLPSVAGLTMNAAELDRRLLAELDRATWNSTVRAVQAALSDSAIAAAVARAPAAYAERGMDLPRALRARRDDLADFADRYYRDLAHVVDVHATDASDLADVRRGEDGSLTIALSGATEADTADVVARRSKGDGLSQRASLPPSRATYFFRRFDPRETAEVRLYLHGGADTVRIAGASRGGVMLRVVLQGTSDRVEGAGGDGARVYRDADGPTPYGPDTTLDRRPWIRSGVTFTPPGPDHGHLVSPRVALRFDDDFGLASRVGVALTSFGFRRLPWATQASFTLDHSTRFDALRAAATVESHRERSRFGARAAGQASRLEQLRFAGLGNETPRSAAGRVYATEYAASVAGTMTLPGGGSVSLGPMLRYTRTDTTRGALIGRRDEYGAGDFGRVGLALEAAMPAAKLDSTRAAALGWWGGATLVPALWDATAAYGAVQGELRAALRLPLPLLAPVLALRAGGRRVWGRSPFEDAAYVGGEATLRGWAVQRFAGRGAAWGGVELRLPVATVNTLVPVDVGVFGLADAARVFASAEASGRWHTGVGGGVWLGLGEPDHVLSFSIADGAEATQVYLRAGFAF